jgi:superfamily II DNA/RNA helicase
MPTTFTDLGLLPSLQASLAEARLVTLTEIQARALPALLGGRSVVGIAETGSGKTLTYVLPILERLKRLEDAGNRVEVESEPRALVVVPTRELGEQVARVFKGFTHTTRLRVRSVLGGQKMKQNQDNVSGLFEVLVATPGRLNRLIERKAIGLDAIRFVVLDEADQLLDLGFLDAIAAVLAAVPERRQLALFSATMSADVKALVTSTFSEAQLIETAGSHKVVGALTTRHVDVPDGDRPAALRPILAEPVTGGTILFANTRAQCDAVASWLAKEGFACVAHRGDMDPKERRDNLRAFRDGQVGLLVATDSGARGLDIPHVARVINVHLPHERDAYLHRVGRTARAGAPGLVINLVTPRDAPLLAQLDDGSKAPTAIRLRRPTQPRPGAGGAARRR